MTRRSNFFTEVDTVYVMLLPLEENSSETLLACSSANRFINSHSLVKVRVPRVPPWQTRKGYPSLGRVGFPALCNIAASPICLSSALLGLC